MKELRKHNFSRVFDLQNSSRTSFYKSILFPKAIKDTWSSTKTTLPAETNKENFISSPSPSKSETNTNKLSP